MRTLTLVPFFLVSCSGDKSGVPEAARVVAPTTGALLDVAGELRAGDALAVGGGFVDPYEVMVPPGVPITVSVLSSAVDAMVLVQPPASSVVSNDDFQGDRTRAQVEVVSAVAGVMKVTVAAAVSGASGPYRLSVSAGAPAAGAPGWPELRVGAPLQGALAQGDVALPTGQLVDGYLLAGGSGQVVEVSARGAPAPLLFVTTPSGRTLDEAADAAGARTLVTLAEPGAYRVQVVSPAPGIVGAYMLAAAPSASVPQNQVVAAHHQTPAPGGPSQPIARDATTMGRLEATDLRLPSGESADRYVLEVQSGDAVTFNLESSAFDPYLVVTSPTGRRWENDDVRGGRNAELAIALPEAGAYQVIVTSYQSGETGEYVLKLHPGIDPVSAPADGATAVMIPSGGATSTAAPASAGAQRRGELAPGDSTLRTGELFDTHTFSWRQGQHVSLRLASTAFDPYLIVRAPSGHQDDNDDASQGVRDSALELTLTETGNYSVLVTSYQSGMRGAYVLTVGGDAPATPTPPTSAPAARGNVISGELRRGDRTTAAGKLEDRHPIRLRRGESVRVELTSSDFDTFLVVQPPSGHPVENDDVSQGNTNSAVDLVASAAGSYTAVVSTFRAGDQGRYELRIVRGASAGAPTPPAAGSVPPATPAGDRPITGTLAAGDATLQSGELTDRYTIDGTAGQLLRLRVTSSAFDPYVILRAPSGRQDDNDDLTPQTRDAGLDATLSETGQYTVTVTSYRPGETGEYRLTMDRRTPETRGGVVLAPPTAGGGRVFGIFAGISDYPSAGDLPECANDARKLAEDLRQTRLMDASQQIVLADGQVTAGAIRQAFATMATQVGPNDTFLFFFSGHGNQREAATDRAELDRKDETIVLYDQELVDDEMAQLYARIGGRVNLIALDSCFSGGFAKDVISAERRMGMFSSEEDLTSAVAGQFQAGGYLSHFLRMAVGGEADSSPRDGQLLAGELQHYLFRQFASHAGDVGATDQNFAQSFQHLVVDRGAVHVSDVLFTYR